MRKETARISKVIIVGLMLLAGPQARSSPQERPRDPSKAFPEIPGLYEVATAPKAVRMQVYFAAGTLRTVADGDATSTVWTAVEAADPAFRSGSPERGEFRMTFQRDERGRFTRFRVVNDKAGLDVAGVRKADFDDAAADPASPSDRIGFLERRYRKSESLVPMRDGVRLFTQVYAPLDASELHPILLVRTPYGVSPYGDAFRGGLFPGLSYAKEGYIIVLQDIRGTSMSEGIFEFIRPFLKTKTSASDVDESSDAYDTIEWALRNVPAHNGRVGVWGISYPGFTAAMAALDAHPAVRAVSPQAPMADLFLGDDGHHYGALYLAHAANYLYTMGQVRKAPTAEPAARLGFPTPDGYSFYLRMGPLKRLTETLFEPSNKPWRELMDHESYDAYWKARSIYPHLRGLKPAILVVGGWYDGEDLLGTLRTYRTIESQNPGLPNSLVMGPWAHSRWNLLAGGTEDRGIFPFSGTRAFFQETVELPFFNRHLKGRETGPTPEAVVFETGTDVWRTYDCWPPAEARDRKLFLAGNGAAAWDQAPPAADPGFDEFVSDPAKPVPYTQQITPRYNPDYFVEDQRFAAARPDVLVYTGPALAESVTLAGPIKAELYVSTTGTDSDWVVKVIDVYPDDAPDPKSNPKGIRMGGYQRLIRGEIIRGKFRNSFETPEPFVPGRIAKVELELPDVQHAFLKGHRIMVQVQCSWFPLFDRNPQTFGNIRTAGEEAFRKTTQRVYRSTRYPSGVVLKVLPRTPNP